LFTDYQYQTTPKAPNCAIFAMVAPASWQSPRRWPASPPPRDRTRFLEFGPDYFTARQYSRRPDDGVSIRTTISYPSPVILGTISRKVGPEEKMVPTVGFEPTTP
jgi:hypothetical protein